MGIRLQTIITNATNMSNLDNKFANIYDFTCATLIQDQLQRIRSQDRILCCSCSMSSSHVENAIVDSHLNFEVAA